jgi:hypothetical protein
MAQARRRAKAGEGVSDTSSEDSDTELAGVPFERLDDDKRAAWIERRAWDLYMIERQHVRTREVMIQCYSEAKQWVSVGQDESGVFAE